MRLCIALLLAMVAGDASAQNWALLNPAYKYNYTNDGTDTISNQIRVMDIDTLAPDSFGYALNLIGVVCDTCPQSLGGPCDGCYVRVDQPQFLGYDCIRSGNDWIFQGADTFLIRAGMGVGSSWLFDAGSGVTALVDEQWAASVFDVEDTLRRILLSTGDTLLIGRSFGILRFPHADEQYDLIGVEGAGVGRLFPDPLAYFDYDVGDELTYSINSVWSAMPPGGPAFPVPYRNYWKVRIDGRLDLTDTVIYTTSVAYTYGDPGYSGWMAQEPIWPVPQGTWSFNRADLLSDHPILAAYPGQVIDTSICWLGPYEEFTPRYVARSGITADGRGMMRSQYLGQSQNGPSSGFNAAQEVLPGVSPFVEDPLIDVHYEEGLGICNVESVYAYFMSSPDMGMRVRLVGAVIAGDTIIAPPFVDWDVGITDVASLHQQIYPNPASDAFTLLSTLGNEVVDVFDMNGRRVVSDRLRSANGSIVVRDLAPGTYVVIVAGSMPQRLMIAR